MTHPVRLIVIGGSAGALEPLMQVLSELPPQVHAPAVLVLHVLPSQPSLLPSLLARVCSRPVREPEDKEPIEADTIYVAPPNYHLLVERNGTLALSVDDPVQFSRPSIDVLFESACDAFGSGVVGILLSGSNADGARGLAKIAQAGGVAIVQAPSTAAHTAMPLEGVQRTPSATSLAPSEIAAFVGGLSG